jgi:S-adenosylmethionine:tRNA-ribosyltransferase-isomerase (queuine synthetase)
MLVSDFGYELPEELIAQRPPEVRGTSRMMTLDRGTGAFADRMFAELPSLLRAGDLLVLNDSRVIPARTVCAAGRVGYAGEVAGAEWVGGGVADGEAGGRGTSGMRW